MIRVFFKGQPVPEWLERFEIVERNPDSDKGVIAVFDSPCAVLHIFGKYFVYAPFVTATRGFIRADCGWHYVRVVGGGGGVRICTHLRTLIRSILNERRLATGV